MCDNFKVSKNTSKSEKDLCRCCHAEGSFKSLYTPYFWLDVEEIMYCNVLRDCFNIELVEMRMPSQQVLSGICYTCIQRLEDAVRFKRQVQKCEKRLQDVYSGCLGNNGACEVIIKEEKLDNEENMLLESTAFDNGSDCSVRLAGDENNGDDIENNDDGDVYDDTDSMLDDGNIIREVDKRFKIRSKKTKKPAKVKKKDRARKKVQPAKDEDVLETIADVIKVVRGPLIKREVDYKATDDGFQCQKCQVTFKTTNGIRRHIRQAHFDIHKYKCPSCYKCFDTATSFTKHKFNEHDIDHRHKCNACEHAFNSKVQLTKHKNTFHMLGVKIKCKDCEYETFSMESLYKHRFKHKTVKDYKCKFCKKAFVRKATLQLHERIHTGDRRKVCAVCGQAFVQKASLNYHMTKYHPEVAF